jgi:hypothetical protein
VIEASTTISKPRPTVIEPSSDFTTFLLAQIRCAELRARIAANELRATAVALAGGLIDAPAALAMLHETDLPSLVEASS